MLADQGYEIHVEEDCVRCLNRHTWALGYGAGTALTAVGLGATIGVLILVRGSGLSDGILAALLLATAGVLGIPGMCVRRVLRTRQSLSVDQVPDAVVFDRVDHTLRSADGNDVARFSEVGISVGFDWLSRGLLRRVLVRWPSGSRVVFRSLSRGRAREAAALLLDLTQSKGAPAGSRPREA